MEKNAIWAKKWDNLSPCKAIKVYQELDLKPSLNVKDMPKLKLKREVLGWLIAAKLSHGYFADYYKRFGHKEVEIQCKCGQKRVQLYPFFSFTTRPHKAKLFNIDKKKLFIPLEILGLLERVRLFTSWELETNLFRRSESSSEVLKT